MKLDFNISRLTDGVLRQNFQALAEGIRNDPYLRGDFRLVEGEITGTSTGQTFKHNLKFVPKDAILTSAIWSGAIGVLTFKNDLFDASNITVAVSGLSTTETVSFRALIGRIEN